MPFCVRFVFCFVFFCYAVYFQLFVFFVGCALRFSLCALLLMFFFVLCVCFLFFEGRGRHPVATAWFGNRPALRLT